ncbi:MAG: PQQ-dependent sugar dehydrogenase [Cyclobacteriaceae bacterium]
MTKWLGVLLLLVVFEGCVQHTDSGDVAQELVPEENRFSKEVFVSNLFEPTELVVLPKGQILFTERNGAIKQYDPNTGEYINYDSISVFYKFEDGLMGMALDPSFSTNQWLYLYYSPQGDEPVQYLSRFTYTKSGLTNEKIVLVVDVQRDQCCHTGGSIEFDADGLLYLSTGDDTNPFQSSGFAPRDERKKRSPWDAGRTSGNTNDLRGKILRIKPELDGTYSIPKGNLFEDDDPLTRPEIYVMGCRNPYRIAIDSKKGFLFWGDVGPDAQNNNEKRGARGHDEFNVALKAGNFGWPLFVGDNQRYRDYDFETGISGDYFDPNKPVNTSPNNTGLTELPSAMPAKIFYPYANSEAFPQLGNGGRNAMAGPVYYSDEFKADDKFPSFFDGRVFFYDWVRGFIYSLSLDPEGNPVDWYPFMPNQRFNNIIDMTFGSDGQLYMIEYGRGWFTRNEDAALSVIKYTSKNRPPVLKATLSKSAGAAPMEVIFDASQSFDYDEDKLIFEWTINDQVFNDSTFTYTFNDEGVYYPELIIKDKKGNKVRKQFTVEIGNEAPKLKMNIDGNKSFYWKGRKVKYSTEVSDLEDGVIGNSIDSSDVVVDISYFQSLDQAEVLGHKLPTKTGLKLMESLDCMACHKIDASSIGPSFKRVSERYAGDPKAVSYLSGKIINGGGGVWGEQAMSAHPELSIGDAESIVNYILSLSNEKSFSLSGTYEITKIGGRYAFQSTYQDKGKSNFKPITKTDRIWLRHAELRAIDFDYSKGVISHTRAGQKTRIKHIYHNSYVGYKDIDFMGIKELIVNVGLVERQGTISVRVGGVDGKEIGKALLEAKHQYNPVTIPIFYQGFDDLYFVFINAGENERMMEIEGFEFVPQK